MALSLPRFSWPWMGGKDKDQIPNGSLVNSLNSLSGFRGESEKLKFQSVKEVGRRLPSSKVKRKWKSREERIGKIDKEYDVVLVPSDGVCLSASESDDSDWSIGWLEPHAPGFRSEDEDEDDSFAVLVPCYKHEEEEEPPSSQFLSVVKNLPDDYSSDMEDKVQSMIKLIEEDGDSFAKRAEMYYKRRPELISSVEEAYRSFKALADRYDLMSKELQNANHTIATVFPEQVQFSMDDEDDCPTPKIPKNAQISAANIPKVPKVPIENLKGLITTASQKFKAKKSTPKPLPRAKNVATSGLSKEEALGEIEKLNKDILAMQTIKEFVKSSYESGLSKYWEIENQIMEKQDKVCRLQDEFEVESVIEDNEARTLMAEAALKSCQETLASLQEKQENATREAREEYKKIEEARQLLKSIRRKYMKEQDDDKPVNPGHESSAQDVNNMHKSEDVDMLPQNAGKDSEFNSLTVTELAEKIDDLVNKVINLETAVSSQTVLISTLRTESDDLHTQIRNLQDEKDTLIDDTHNLSIRVKELEEKLNKVQDLNKDVESQNNNLHTNFAEARSSLGNLSEKLSSVKPDEEVEVFAQDEPRTLHEPTLLKEIKDQNDVQSPVERQKGFSVSETESSKTEGTEDVKEVDVSIQGSLGPSIAEKAEIKNPAKKTVTFLDYKPKDKDHPSEPVESEEMKGDKAKEVDDVSWQQMLLSGTEDKEKILLKEYTAILRNYKDVKKKLSDTEKKDKDLHFDMMVQMRELKEAILKRDQEIQHLRKKLNRFQGENNEGGLLPDSSENQQMKPQSGNEELEKNEDFNDCITSKEDEIKLICIDRSPTISPVEEKLREEIDAILDENLDFWLRFSTSHHEVQKFKSEVKDLQDEISKLNDKKKQERNATNELKSEARPIYKHLREIQTELTVWSEHSASLKEELKRRFSSLCRIQEEITKAMSEGVEEGEIRFSSHQAAKLQGEILNMKQENNKVREELQSRFDHVSVLQLEIEKTVTQMNEEFGIATDQPQMNHSMSRSRVPLRSFIFGTRAKKQKHSLFSFMHHNRKFQVVRAGLPHSSNNS